jgi:hypothetical protein
VRLRCKRPRPRQAAVAALQMACMLPPPFGSAPPAIPGIAQPRRRARARRRCVQRADARAGGHLQPSRREPLIWQAASPQSGAPQPRDLLRRGGGPCAATVQSCRPSVPAAAVPDSCWAALAPSPPPGSAAHSASTGREGQPRWWGRPAAVDTQACARAPCGWGTAVRAAAEQHTAGVVEREAPAAERKSQARLTSGGPDARCSLPSGVACVPAQRGGWAGPGGVCTHEGVPLLRSLAGAAADKLGVLAAAVNCAAAMAAAAL